ncbi:MAG: CCA tRNA nucleotidyltransferase [Eubacteriales bacterium]|jgi:tRNA nucleotidyltransferase (CCA-adding enzyme)|nr:CCA tRNA nucleotidyltransferase [Clostridiales bacterium]
MELFRLPEYVRRTLFLLEDSGYEAYVVGGCVRDLYMGVELHDYDITTSATPEAVKDVFRGERIIDTGIRHGTVTLVVEDGAIEITTYRKDDVYSDRRRPDSVTFTRTLTDDLCRRDFTMNAMAYSPQRGLVDIFGGREHIDKGLIVCVGDARERFREDALRILRALRFASLLNFKIEESAAVAINEEKSLLRFISAERIYAEFTRIIMGSSAAQILLDYKDVILTILPELSVLAANDYIRAARAAGSADDDLYVRLALFMRDTGADVAAAALRRLKADGAAITKTSLLIRYYNRGLFDNRQKIKLLLREISNDDARRLACMLAADAAIGDESRGTTEVSECALRTIDEIEASGECVRISDLAISGDDIIAAGVPEGKQIGQILTRLLDLVTSGAIKNERDALMSAVRDMSLSS